MRTGFGWIEIDGFRYDHDVIIHADATITKRKKKLSKSEKDKYGHTPLSEKELDFLTEEDPELVFVGTGQYGDLPLTPETEAVLALFHSVVKPTP
jgi:hypothetical protein